MIKKREKLLNVIIGTSVSVVSVVSLYISFCIYHKSFISVFEYPSFKLFSTIIIFELLLLNLMTGINRGILNRGIFREGYKSFQETLFVLSGLILLIRVFQSLIPRSSKIPYKR